MRPEEIVPTSLGYFSASRSNNMSVFSSNFEHLSARAF